MRCETFEFGDLVVDTNNNMFLALDRWTEPDDDADFNDQFTHVPVLIVHVAHDIFAGIVGLQLVVGCIETIEPTVWHIRRVSRNGGSDESIV